jgi:hypothetical protein
MPLVASQPVTCSKCPAFYRTKLRDQRGTITSSGWISRTKKFSPPPGRRKLSLTSAFIGRDLWPALLLGRDFGWSEAPHYRRFANIQVSI